MNDEQKRICAELDHIQKYFEAKADTCIGQGKMLLLNWANVVRDALELLKEQETLKQCLKEKCSICPHCEDCDVDDSGRIAERG
jgi:hypothetical protein